MSPEPKITFTNPNQILNMGGPHIADLLLDDKLVASKCIDNHYLYSPKLNSLYFVQYQLVSRYYWYFSISFIYLDENTMFKYDREFKCVFIKKFASDYELEIYHAFHDRPSRKEIFNLYEEPYS
jgi:hypothetical protein